MFNSSAGSLYWRRYEVVAEGAHILQRIFVNGNKHLSSLTGHLNVLVLSLKCISCISASPSSKTFRITPIHQVVSYMTHDFGLSAEWNFFATAHGKSPCDGIGGSVKRVTTVESLKRIKYDQIQTPEEMYTFCHKHFSHISFFYIPKSEIFSTGIESRDPDIFSTRIR